LILADGLDVQEVLGVARQTIQAVSTKSGASIQHKASSSISNASQVIEILVIVSGVPLG
jgi:hypothetical protein